MSRICGIYKIQNKVNGKVYVGASRNIKARFRQHKSTLRNNVHICKELQSEYNEYGEDKFFHEVLEVCDEELLNKREQFWTDKLKSNNANYGYNRRKDVTNNGGIEFTEEAKKNVRKNKPVTKGKKNGMYGKTHTEEIRKRLSENHKGSKNWMFGKGMLFSGENSSGAKLKHKDVYDILKAINDGATISELSTKYNVSYQCIWKIKSGLTWKNIDRTSIF